MCLLHLVLLALNAWGQSPPERVFPQPSINDVYGRSRRLDYCLHWSGGCGCPAALSFCQSKGYPYVDRFRKDPRLDLEGYKTALLGEGGSICPGVDIDRTCDGFTEIHCSQRPRQNPNQCRPPVAPPQASVPAHARRKRRKTHAPQFEAAEDIPDSPPPSADAPAQVVPPEAGAAAGGDRAVNFFATPTHHKAGPAPSGASD